MATSFRLADHREYRRGVILGLTLAEILVLLVFLLLLASGAILARRDKQVVDLQAALADYRSLLQPIMARANQAGFDIHDTNQLVALLERGKTADSLARELETTKSALAQARAEADRTKGEIEKLRAALNGLSSAQRETIAKAADDEAVAVLLERIGSGSGKPSERLRAVLAKDLNLTGQNAQMRTELARLKGNGGSGLPYCWTTLEGHPIYMLRVELRDDGVLVHDIVPRPKPDDQAWSVLDGVPRNTLMPVGKFLSDTVALQAMASAGKCHYALLAIDSTALTNKPGYKMLMGRLWSAFMVHEVSL